MNMQSFAQYFLTRELADETMMSESSDHIKKKHVSHFYEKFPNVQYEDVEDAFEEAKEKNGKQIKKEMESILSGMNKKKRGIKKNLSCVKAIKSAANGESLSSLMKRASKTLTSKEKKVVNMCSQGKSVRSIGTELNISSATAWRLLNSAIDKIRMSHGMRSRHMDRR